MVKKTALLLIALFVCLICFAQSEEASPDKRIAFGFNLGLNYSNLTSKEKPLPNDASFSNALGYKLGILMDYAITPFLLISPKAELTFNNGSVNFPNAAEPQQTYEVLPMSLDLMAHIVLKNKLDNSAIYALVGPNLRIPLKQSDNPTQFSSNTDVAFDFGFGFDKPIGKFSFAPEFRYSLGLRNINESPLLQSVYLHTISLVFNFKK